MRFYNISSEWGLIAMAGILGIVGFMVIRRRKVTA
ncbi:MAG: IPTL-CTERM sorting domain-containing protein [Thermodesulfobacteriales bacterium]|nr:MAG: IPTL-CTERM sorting domain-containing protein [Thermodesulfobacteriales bacterium]